MGWDTNSLSAEDAAFVTPVCPRLVFGNTVFGNTVPAPGTVFVLGKYQISVA